MEIANAFADLTRFSVVTRSESSFTIYQRGEGSEKTRTTYGDNLVPRHVGFDD